MSGDVQPRKRKEKRRKKEDSEELASNFSSDEHIHVHKDASTGGNMCAKILFFLLFFVLVVMIGLVVFEYRGSGDDESLVPVSKWASTFDGWLDEVPAKHNEHADVAESGEHDEHAEDLTVSAETIDQRRKSAQETKQNVETDSEEEMDMPKHEEEKKVKKKAQPVEDTSTVRTGKKSSTIHEKQKEDGLHAKVGQPSVQEDAIEKPTLTKPRSDKDDIVQSQKRIVSEAKHSADKNKVSASGKNTKHGTASQAALPKEHDEVTETPTAPPSKRETVQSAPPILEKPITTGSISSNDNDVSQGRYSEPQNSRAGNKMKHSPKTSHHYPTQKDKSDQLLKGTVTQQDVRDKSLPKNFQSDELHDDVKKSKKETSKHNSESQHRATTHVQKNVGTDFNINNADESGKKVLTASNEKHNVKTNVVVSTSSKPVPTTVAPPVRKSSDSKEHVADGKQLPSDSKIKQASSMHLKPQKVNSVDNISSEKKSHIQQEIVQNQGGTQDHQSSQQKKTGDVGKMEEKHKKSIVGVQKLKAESKPSFEKLAAANIEAPRNLEASGGPARKPGFVDSTKKSEINVDPHAKSKTLSAAVAPPTDKHHSQPLSGGVSSAADSLTKKTVSVDFEAQERKFRGGVGASSGKEQAKQSSTLEENSTYKEKSSNNKAGESGSNQYKQTGDLSGPSEDQNLSHEQTVKNENVKQADSKESEVTQLKIAKTIGPKETVPPQQVANKKMAGGERKDDETPQHKDDEEEEEEEEPEPSGASKVRQSEREAEDSGSEKEVPITKSKIPKHMGGQNAQVYLKADITNEDDWSIVRELDRADDNAEEKPENAILQYDTILKSNPNSPRAWYGKASALDQLAAKKKSNLILDQAIDAYKKVTSTLNNVPDKLFTIAAERCIDRMRFRGVHAKAVHIHKLLMARFPENPDYSNQLAVTYLMINRLPDAKLALENVLQKWPRNGFAQVHYGFILKTGDYSMAEAVKYLQQGIATREPGTIDGRFFFQLGDALTRLGRRKEATEVNELGVKEGLFLSKHQRSLYNVDRLRAQPWWLQEDTNYTPYFRMLEKNWLQIKNEGVRALNDINKNLFRDEAENLKDSGKWKQLELFARGRKNQVNCAKAPVTCKLIEEFPAARDCRRGQVKFSVMDPGTHVWPHCGPTNCRLRAHLGLVVPKNTYIRVAEETRSWEEGKLFIFDDSFEHEVWHNGTTTRLVLIVDVWHPELTAEEKRSLPAI